MKNPEKRLGGGKEDAEEVKRHPFYASVNWQEVYDRKVSIKNISTLYFVWEDQRQKQYYAGVIIIFYSLSDICQTMLLMVGCSR